MTASGTYEDVYRREANPGLFNAIRTRRSIAFLLDAVFITILTVIAAFAIGILGIVTLGLGWLLYGIVWPGIAILYYLFSLGMSGSATPGMQLTGLELRMLNGATVGPLVGIAHPILFYVSVTLLTPLVVLAGLFSSRGRLLHDLVLSTVMVDREARRNLV